MLNPRHRLLFVAFRTTCKAVYYVHKSNTTSKAKCTSDLSEFGSGIPSRLQLMLGVGVAWAEHLRDTPGPGCTVCSMNVYSSAGEESANRVGLTVRVGDPLLRAH